MREAHSATPYTYIISIGFCAEQRPSGYAIFLQCMLELHNRPESMQTNSEVIILSGNGKA